ncbi:MAG: class I SAM-dependent methyltransferase [Planctomycetota bacterium]
MERIEADFYADPAVYDVLHTPGTAAEVDGLERLALRFVRTEDTARDPVWLEPACGTGRYLRVAAGRGCRVIGVDLSEAMVAYARQRCERLGFGDRCLFHAGPMERLGDHVVPASVDFAFCLINSVRHIETDEGMLEHLESVRASLRPGGVYAVGLGTSRAEWEFETEDVWEARRGSMGVRQVVQYTPPASSRARFERVISHMTVRRGARTETIDSTYRLRTYRIERWRELMELAGLRLVGVTDEDGRDVEAPVCGYAVWVLALDEAR